jgi:hypothetical protein
MLVSVQYRCIVCAKRTIGSEIILDAPNGTPRWRASSESFIHLEIGLILMQDRCSVCVKHTTELLGDVGHVESRFFQFGDNVSVDAR